MLAEWLAYLSTPCPPELRRLGYLREIIGTRSRHARCRAAWEPHLANTRRAILDAAQAAPRHRKAVVFGSGWLFDVPLDELCATFAEVVLVDLLHMPTVRRRAAGHPNVRLVTTDLTGVVADLAKPGLPVPSGALPEADLLVSANLLTQLPFLPCRALRRRQPPPGEEEIEAVAAAIVRHHLAGLETAGGTVCLVTEIEQRLYEDGRPVESFDPLYGVDPGAFQRDWTWDLAPKPEIHRWRDLRCRVAARIVPPKEAD